jgi:glycosyltransferase involved in cell wall biosynthesis
VWPRFDRIQVFTEHDAATIRASTPTLAGRVRVNPFGIELSPLADPVHEDARSIVFNGSFAHPPNVDAALWLGHEIMPLLRVRRPGVRLSLVGDNPPQAVRGLGCEDITVTGQVPTVEPYLERAAVVLAPIRLGGGMRRKVLQGMALGKAVVTTPIGAEGLAVKGCLPPLIVARNAEEIADAVVRLLDDANARHALGHRAHTFVAHYHSWTRYEQRLDALYAELLGTN